MVVYDGGGGNSGCSVGDIAVVGWWRGSMKSWYACGISSRSYLLRMFPRTPEMEFAAKLPYHIIMQPPSNRSAQAKSRRDGQGSAGRNYDAFLVLLPYFDEFTFVPIKRWTNSRIR